MCLSSLREKLPYSLCQADLRYKATAFCQGKKKKITILYETGSQSFS